MSGGYCPQKKENLMVSTFLHSYQILASYFIIKHLFSLLNPWDYVHLVFKSGETLPFNLTFRVRFSIGLTTKAGFPKCSTAALLAGFSAGHSSLGHLTCCQVGAKLSWKRLSQVSLRSFGKLRNRISGFTSAPCVDHSCSFQSKSEASYIETGCAAKRRFYGAEK